MFDAFGPDFTLLALDAEDAAVEAFSRAAKSLDVPLDVIRDSCTGGREAYEARLILVRPDQYVVWAGDGLAERADELIRRVVGRD